MTETDSVRQEQLACMLATYEAAVKDLERAKENFRSCQRSMARTMKRWDVRSLKHGDTIYSNSGYADVVDAFRGVHVDLMAANKLAKPRREKHDEEMAQ